MKAVNKRKPFITFYKRPHQTVQSLDLRSDCLISLLIKQSSSSFSSLNIPPFLSEETTIQKRILLGDCPAFFFSGSAGTFLELTDAFDAFGQHGQQHASHATSLSITNYVNHVWRLGGKSQGVTFSKDSAKSRKIIRNRIKEMRDVVPTIELNNAKA